jgi:hypothetical protein
MRAPVLSSDDVHRIRTERRPDPYWERTLGVTRTCVQKARVGITWQTHPTPPDSAPRIENNPNSRKGRTETDNLPQMSDEDARISRALANWRRVEPRESA